ncbi:hypothetical protein, partial [Bifidobacterium longum]|uniref:hypothetical protein n=1 Tax=Bifidobacterium longum TaxID=216816 RepID=UPI0032195E5E
ERTVSELIIATGTGEDQSAQKLGHYQTQRNTSNMTVSYANYTLCITYFNKEWRRTSELI